MTIKLPTLKFTPSPNYSSRSGRVVDKIIVHSCEGNSAGATNWFSQARSQVSAHIVLSEDGATATQMVAWANKAWACCSFNPVTENIEGGGYAARGFGPSEWDAMAAIVAYRLHANNLPCRWAEQGIGSGFARHYDLGAAGGNHTDPTTDLALWQGFMARVESAYAQPMPDVWRPDFPSTPVPVAPPGFIPSTDPRHDLPYGSIAWVQAALNALHIPHTPLTVDGLDGKLTRSAVVDFQEHHTPHLFIDGEAGVDTCAALEKALAA